MFALVFGFVIVVAVTLKINGKLEKYQNLVFANQLALKASGMEHVCVLLVLVFSSVRASVTRDVNRCDPHTHFKRNKTADNFFPQKKKLSYGRKPVAERLAY